MDLVVFQHPTFWLGLPTSNMKSLLGSHLKRFLGHLLEATITDYNNLHKKIHKVWIKSSPFLIQTFT